MSQSKNRIEELEGILREGGVRVTRQRAAILKILAEAEDHPDASELHRRAKEIDATVSLSTVYRTLSALEQQGWCSGMPSRTRLPASRRRMRPTTIT